MRKKARDEAERKERDDKLRKATAATKARTTTATTTTAAAPSAAMEGDKEKERMRRMLDDAERCVRSCPVPCGMGHLASLSRVALLQCSGNCTLTVQLSPLARSLRCESLRPPLLSPQSPPPRRDFRSPACELLHTAEKMHGGEVAGGRAPTSHCA